MAVGSRKVTIEFHGDDVSATRVGGKVESRMSKLGRTMGKVGLLAAKGLAAGTAVAAVGLFKAGQKASDLNETVSKTEQIFGKAITGGLVKWAETADVKLGQSKQTALDAASTFGIFGKAAGLSGKDLEGFAKQNTRLAADMASFFNTEPEEAIMAIGAAFRGETEPIRRFGVMLDDATMREEALRLGLVKTTSEALKPQIKTLAAQSLIMKQTKDVQGDFARTSGGLANQQRILKARFENFATTVGQAVLPMLLKLATWANDTLIPALKDLAAWVQEHVVPALKDFGRWANDHVVPALKAFGEFLRDRVLPALADFWAWMKDRAAPAVKDLAEKVLPVARKAFEQVRDAIKRNGPQLRDMFNAVKKVAEVISAVLVSVALQQLIRGLKIAGKVISFAIDYVGALWRMYRKLAEGIRDAARTISAKWEDIKAATSRARAAVQRALSRFWQAIVDWFVDMRGKIAARWDAFKGWVRGWVLRFADMFGGMREKWDAVRGWVSDRWSAFKGWVAGWALRIPNVFSGLLSSFRSVLNTIIGWWNGLSFSIPSFKVGPKTFGGATIGLPNIPYLAEGGVVRARPGGTLAVLGEAGEDEAVVPLSRLRSRDEDDRPIVIHLMLDGEKVYTALLRLKRRRGGGGLGLA